MSALLVYPTHANLHEERRRLEESGFQAVAYPVRSADESDPLANCWNREGDAAEAVGFSVLKSVCPGCSRKHDCQNQGYLAQLVHAREADVSLATHQRVAYSGFVELVADRDYCAVHESATDLLRPTCELDVQDLDVIRGLLNRALQDPRFLDTLAVASSRADSEPTSQEVEQIRRRRWFDAAVAMLDILDDLHRQLLQVEVTTTWIPPQIIKLPVGFESFLWRISAQAQFQLRRAPWRFLLAALGGELASAAIIVTSQHVRGAPQGTVALHKSILGVRHNPPPSGKVIWFNDATADPARLAQAIGAPVTDQTPEGSLPQQKLAVQYIRDVKRKTEPEVAKALLYGLLALRREARKVGLITHRPLLPVVAQLEPEFRERIVMSTHFGSGQERSSNDWHKVCDLIVVLGTPRLPPHAVASYLVQLGETEAAGRTPEWDTVYWQAELFGGETQLVDGVGYLDPAWRSAQRDLVRSTLVQAVGRGRLALESGCEVVVFSNEECGLKVIPGNPPWLNAEAMRIYVALRELTRKKPKESLLGKVRVTTAEVCAALGGDLSDDSVGRYLNQLVSLKLVERVGRRSGWRLALPAGSGSDTPTITQEAACAQ